MVQYVRRLLSTRAKRWKSKIILRLSKTLFLANRLNHFDHWLRLGPIMRWLWSCIYRLRFLDVLMWKNLLYLSFELQILSLELMEHFPERLILLFECSDFGLILGQYVGVIFLKGFIFILKILYKQLELILVFSMLSEGGLSRLKQGLKFGVLLWC